MNYPTQKDSVTLRWLGTLARSKWGWGQPMRSFITVLSVCVAWLGFCLEGFAFEFEVQGRGDFTAYPT